VVAAGLTPAQIFAALAHGLEAVARQPRAMPAGRVATTHELAIVGAPLVVVYAVSAEAVILLAILHADRAWSESPSAAA
jgi:hypothetical protein